ncbi:MULTISPECIES: DUF1128 domain-containing protein [Paenibacillus]|uniref:DUF1128 domain-containing protein n=1 Tax=Paenibacillus radicis (ex Xue et al. 2023) TaxID=2972489 RepID=A0ABT1YH22_9BACL|nr:DUF1128 domain-containing protein [Paenibacillus radicis (ex Xue et al. 2023)]MCR8632506.1 DUF1128 domain-containing protein [Paenibacillus radicis (ex Xue et al. 2023)]
MDLSENTLVNTEFMMEEIKTKLRMATGAALRATQLNNEQYVDLKDIYEMVASKSQFSISEIEAITTELGRLRKP